MQIPFLDLKLQTASCREEIREAMDRVISDCNFVLGRQVEEFEAAFAACCECDYALGVASGLDALKLILRAMDIGPGDEVITPSHTFIATALAISAVGATPILVEVDPKTYTMDPAGLDAAITGRTKVLMPVHLYGQTAGMDPILEIARKHGLRVIEDACQAHGARYKGQRAGSLGDAAAFSFYPGKNLGAYGDAGCMVTSDDDIAHTARMIAQHGQSGEKHKHFIEGRNSRMDGIQAAILNVKLAHLDDWTEARIRHAAVYGDLLKDLPLQPPQQRSGNRHVFHLYVIRTDKRDELRNYLTEKGIATAIQYPHALPFLDAYAKRNHSKEDFPVISGYQKQILSLPMFPELAGEEINYIVSQIRNYFM